MKVKSQSPGRRGNATASTRRMGNQPGGGIGSKVVRREGTRDGQKAFSVNPAAVSQLGGVYGSHITDHRNETNYRGEPWTKGPPPISVPLGNELAKNVGKGGPGAGREVFKCGSQGQCGPVRDPIANTKDILREFGPDSSNARNRR